MGTAQPRVAAQAERSASERLFALRDSRNREPASRTRSRADVLPDAPAVVAPDVPGVPLSPETSGSRGTPGTPSLGDSRGGLRAPIPRRARGVPGLSGPGRADLPDAPGTPSRAPLDESRAAITAPLPIVGAAPRSFARVLQRWVPVGWRGARLDPGRPGAIALAVVAAVAAVCAAVGVWRDRPVAEALPPLAVASTAPEDGPPSAAPPPGAGPPLVVSVAGKVRQPGLVRLPDGSRVADAIAQAGGPLRGADLTTVNLARRLTDGEQILVGLPQPVEPPPGPAAAAPRAPAGAATGGKVNLNRATLEQLDSLPGVGPVTAQRILDWRGKHGRFTSVEQLREIEGIGERRFGQLKDQVSI